MMIKVNVKHHEYLGSTDHIESVNLIHHDENVILFDINLKTKYKEVDAYGGATDSGCQSVWVGFDEVQLTLPPAFKHNVIFAEASRYTIHVCVYRFALLDEMSEKDYTDVVLWERPDDS